jgi:hypothetical protein
MSRTVWAAAGGSYSDYRVYALFESEDAAEAFVDAAGRALWAPPRKDGRAEILACPEYVEEFTLHAQAPEIHEWWKASFSLHKGEVTAASYNIEGSAPPPRPLVFMEKQPPFGELAKAGFPRTPIAWCADKEAAIKSVKDRMAALKVGV